MKKHFLVVDDSELNLRVAQALLEKQGISADYVSSAEHAYTALEESTYDLVFIDYLMPGINGIEATKHIRKMSKGHSADYFTSIPIIALTAEESSELKQLMLTSGFNAVIGKPIQPSEMTDVITRFAPTVHGIDEDTLIGMLDSDRSSYLELIQIFVNDAKKSHDIIVQSLDSGDYTSYTVEVHKIKGEAKVIGATALSEAAKVLEFSGKAVTGDVPNGKTPDDNIRAIKRDTPKFLTAIEKIVVELNELIRDIGVYVENDSDSATDTAVTKVLEPELNRLRRYSEHALEALDSGDTKLTKDWLIEISDVISSLLK